MANEIWAVKDIPAGSVVEFLAYLTKRSSGNRVAVVQADISSIAYDVWVREEEDGFEPATWTSVGSGTLLKTVAISDTVLTGSAWDGLISSGFNFIGKIPGENFPDPSKTYRIRFTFTTTGGDISYEWAEVKTLLDTPA